MQILRLLLSFCLVVGVTSILASCAPRPKEEAPTPTVEEETTASEEEVTEESSPAEESPATETESAEKAGE